MIDVPTPNTAFLLMAQYNGQALIPIDVVCRDFFPHLDTAKLLRKVSSGNVALPVVRIEASQKCHKGVHLADLAAYLDERRATAIKEMRQLRGDYDK